MVLASSSGRVQSQARLRSRMVTAALDLDRAVGLRLDAGGRLDVVLVGDVADDLLDDVLERDEPLQRAVLVDDQREVGAPAQELAHLLVERRRFGHEVGLHRHVHDVEALERPVAGAVLAHEAVHGAARGPWRGSRRRCSPARRGRSGCGCAAS